MRHSPLERMPKDIREERLAIRVRELQYERDQLQRQVVSMRAQVERKNMRLAAMGLEVREMAEALRTANA